MNPAMMHTPNPMNQGFPQGGPGSFSIQNPQGGPGGPGTGASHVNKMFNNQMHPNSMNPIGNPIGNQPGMQPTGIHRMNQMNPNTAVYPGGIPGRPPMNPMPGGGHPNWRPNQPGQAPGGPMPHNNGQMPTQGVPGQPGQPGNPNQGGGLGNNLANNVNQDPDKRKMIQNQLIILIHAAKCQKRTDGNADGSVS